MDIFKKRLDGQQDIKVGVKGYRRKCVEASLRSWLELAALPVAKVSSDNCTQWAERFARDYSASVHRNTVSMLPMILAVAVEKGARATNPAAAVTKRRINQRELSLPGPDQFEKGVTSLRRGRGMVFAGSN